MRIGHYQCICHPGKFETNLQTVLTGLELAAERGLEVLCFPETLLTGYWRSEKFARANSWPVDSPQTERLLAETAGYPSTFIVGFNEARGELLYDSAVVVEGGRLLGTYSKAFPVMPYFTPSRETPVFERDGVKFGVVICADGGFPEPTR
ncbi:MAG: carbon-nitrogen hydrolase family protein, partial [Armatimonadetes bacterium]|nr:carbon-nitrogen hydrolase family protein [Armatimonadota bacterium]